MAFWLTAIGPSSLLGQQNRNWESQELPRTLPISKTMMLFLYASMEFLAQQVSQPPAFAISCSQSLTERLDRAVSAKIWVGMKIIKNFALQCVAQENIQFSRLQTALSVLQIERLIKPRWGETSNVQATLMGRISATYPSLRSLGNAVISGISLREACQNLGHVFQDEGYNSSGPIRWIFDDGMRGGY